MSHHKISYPALDNAFGVVFGQKRQHRQAAVTSLCIDREGLLRIGAVKH